MHNTETYEYEPDQKLSDKLYGEVYFPSLHGRRAEGRFTAHTKSNEVSNVLDIFEYVDTQSPLRISCLNTIQKTVPFEGHLQSNELESYITPIINRLIDIWIEQMGLLPGITRAVQYPVVEAVVLFGRPSSKIILNRMKSGVKYLEYILEKIYEVNPVPESARGNHDFVTLSWETFINAAENSTK